MRKIKKEVRKFLEEFHLKDLPTCDQLVQILKKQGFITVYFDPQHISEYVQDLADKLDLHDALQKKDGFAYRNGELKFVFVNQTLDNVNQACVLLHEEAHIYLGHFDGQEGICNMHAQQEDNAHTFTFLLHKEIQNDNKWILYIITTTSVALSLAAILIFRAYSPDAPKPTGDTLFTTSQTDVLTPDMSKADSGTIADPDTHTYYWTQSGTVYHMYADCSHLKNSTNVQSGSIDQSNKERCCKTCYARYLEESHSDSGE